MLDLSKSPIHVVGAAETPLGLVYGHDEFSMIQQATFEALDEAGLGIDDIDGVFTTMNPPEFLSVFGLTEYLGLRNVRYMDSTSIAGTSFLTYIHHAMVALATGRCNVALIAYASRQRTKKFRFSDMPRPSEESQLWQYDMVYKGPLPATQHALAAARHMYQYGTTLEHLAHVAVTARKWAQLNPKAFLREPLTLEQAMASPKVVEPLRRVDFCLRTDGGGVLIMTRADRARDARVKPIRVLGAGESCTHLVMGQMPDLTISPGAAAGREALAMAGVSVKDVDFLQAYDGFTIMPILAVEDLGFVAKGEGGPFFASGAAAPGGSLPCMTSGGGLSYCHPGMFGLLLAIEAVRQLRHECGERQVPEAKIGVCYGFGGPMAANSTVVLARE